MIPTINGVTYNFVNSGLYDALFVMEDKETKSLWNHVTGEAMYGEHAGYKMPVSNLLQMNVTQALALDPTMQIAISEQAFSNGGSGVATLEDPSAALMDMFSETLGTEDSRRERMEMGLGIWTDNGTYRFYPTEVIRENDRVILDQLEDQSLLVYMDPVISVPVALFVDAQTASVEGRNIVLDGGRVVTDGQLMNASMEQLDFEKPQQIFTRWYGFSLSFPNPEVYE